MILIHLFEGAQQFSSGKGHFYGENVSFYWNLAEGTTAKAQGTSYFTKRRYEIVVKKNIKTFKLQLPLEGILLSAHRFRCAQFDSRKGLSGLRSSERLRPKPWSSPPWLYNDPSMNPRYLPTPLWTSKGFAKKTVLKVGTILYLTRYLNHTENWRGIKIFK